MLYKIKEIYKYKDLLLNLTVKDLKLKYKNSALGFFWSFLNPLMMLIVYTFAFKYVMKIQIPNFSVFLLAGLLPWIFFQTSIQVGTNSIVSNGTLVKKVYFPREIIPLSGIFANFINFLMTLVVLFGAIFIMDVKMGVSILLLPIILALFLMFTIGLTLLLSALNVIYRDVSHFIEIIFMAWFYVTPVVYSMDLIPKSFKFILLINPMTLVVECVRSVMIYDKLPNIYYTLGLICYSLFFLSLGEFVFSKIEKCFAEEI